ncbi:hypothetical protein AC249_AIPGENE11907 [Exaiptasia diaphana]|nr:hypothetical protein AC249_AIPGENE11907 [Exaiptasia diaphana]
MGNTRKRSITEQIGTTREQHLDLLFLGCGDLRNVLCTVSELSQRRPHHCPKSIDIHLNDYDPTILPRNAIILDIIGHINPDIPDDMDFLWNVWYNMTLSKSDDDRLRQVITSLINKDQNDGNGIALRFQDSRTEQECLSVWKDWLELNLDVETVKEERRRFSARKMSIKTMCLYVLKNLQILTSDDLLDESNPLYPEIEHWFMEGSTSATGTSASVINPTLIRPFTHKWKVHYSSCPFKGYFPFKMADVERCKSLTSVCKEILAFLVKQFQQFNKQHSMKISLWSGDALWLCTSGLPSEMLFDVIDTSNVSDHIGLLNVLICCGPRLKRKLPDDVLSNEEWLYWVKAETVRTPLTLTSKESDIITALWYLTERCFNLIEELHFGQRYGASLSSPLTLLRIIHQMGPLIQGGGSVVEVQVDRLQLSVTEMFKDKTPIPKLVIFSEKQHPFDILLSGGFNSCPVISNSIRFNVKEGTVTFHMLESDWKSIEPESLCNIVEYKTGIPVFCCGPFLLFDDKIRLKYVDPLATFGLHAVQTFCIENDTASSSALLEITKLEEENRSYTAELEIFDVDKCNILNIKDMKTHFTPETCPTEINLHFPSIIGCKITFSCPVVSHSSKFQLSKKQKRIVCRIPKKEHWVTGEMVLRNPAQVPFYAMDKWDTKSDDIISICGAMFRSGHDLKLKSLRATGPPFYALRESIQIILQVELKEQSSQFVHSVEDEDHIQSLIMQPRDILSKIGLIIKVKKPIYKWKSIPYAKCIFYDCKQHTDIMNINPVKADKMALDFWKEACNTRKVQAVHRIIAEPGEIDLFRRMLYINAARTEQENPAVSVWKSAFICPLYPRDGMPHKDAMANLVDLQLIHKNLDLPEATNVGGTFPPDHTNQRENLGDKTAEPAHCAFCQKLSTHLKRCNRCNKVSYCNHECQTQHWRKQHRQYCLVSTERAPSKGLCSQTKSMKADLQTSLDLCCAFCKNPSKDLKKCTGCKKVFYCNRECQKQHWKKEHKLVCNKRQGQN